MHSIIKWISLNAPIISAILGIISSLALVYYSESRNSRLNNIEQKEKEYIEAEKHYIDKREYQELQSLFPWYKSIELYDKESLSKLYWYIPILIVMSITIDFLSTLVKFNYYRYFMTICIIIFAVFIIAFGCSLSYKSIKKLENTDTKKKILKSYSPWTTVVVAYISLIMVAFKAIPLTIESPVRLLGSIRGNISMLPLYMVQLLLILSLITVRNGIISHCNQKITNYKTNRIYNYLLNKISNQQKEIRKLRNYKVSTGKLKNILDQKEKIYYHLIESVDKQQHNIIKLKNYIKSKL